MTIRTLALTLLRDAGIRLLSQQGAVDNSDTRGVGTGDLDAIVTTINASYQELWNKSPSSMFERREGTHLFAPTQITVSVAENSTAISITSGSASWMKGCTLQISGDSYDHEFTDLLTQLMRPYLGPTGTTSATVYHDAIQLDSETATVIDPVQIRGLRILQPATQDEFTRSGGVFMNVKGRMYWGVASVNKRSGQPLVYFVDSRYSDASPSTKTNYLRIAPMPSGPYPLDYHIRAMPPVITAEDIDNGDHVTDPRTSPIIPWPDATLTAIARQRFSSDPMFTNKQGLAEIARQYKEAVALMQQSDAMGPSQRSVTLDDTFRKLP